MPRLWTHHRELHAKHRCASQDDIGTAPAQEPRNYLGADGPTAWELAQLNIQTLASQSSDHMEGNVRALQCPQNSPV